MMSFQFSRIADLTQPLSEDSPNYEGSEKSPFEARALGDHDRDGYFSRHLSLPEHFSTHMDAPAHFCRTGWTLDQIPPERLMGPLAVLDIRSRCAADPDYELSLDDVAQWEARHGRVPVGAVLLADSGWSAYWNDMKRYRGGGFGEVMHFPGFHHDAVRYLVEQRGVVGFGIDTMGVDHGPSDRYLNHYYNGAHNIYHLENLADMSGLPPSGAYLLALPAKLRGGSGGPVRVLALVP